MTIHAPLDFRTRCYFTGALTFWQKTGTMRRMFMRSFTEGSKRSFKIGSGLFSHAAVVLVLAGCWLGLVPTLHSQPDAATVESTNSPAAAVGEAELIQLKLDLTNAYKRVLQIVNQPVKAYVRVGNISVTEYKSGWFHPGAAKPDFNTVDVRQSQELTYAQFKFVTSDLNPGLVFLGQDLEFNPMTKYFYTNRALPKHKLSDAEMQEINQLYRIIGKCEAAIYQSQADHATAPSTTKAVQPVPTEGETEQVIPGQSFETIRAIPKRTRAIYAGIAIGILLLMVIALRLLKKKPE